MNATITAQQYKSKHGYKAIMEAHNNLRISLNKRAREHWENVIEILKNL